MILVFGASGHIGGALAAFAAQQKARMRLVTSNPAKVAELAWRFPASEVVLASYLDQASLRAALVGVESVFVVTPDFIDERQAMGVLVQALREQGEIRSIVRILGDPPNMTLRRIPERLRAFGKGTATQHLVAKQLLDESGLPLTYLNIASYLMDDLLRWSGPIRSHRLLAMPFDRRTCWVDPAEIGEAAARILLSGDVGHVGQHYDLDDGEDLVAFSAVATLMSEVLQETVTYEPDPDVWRQMMGPKYEALFGPGAADYFLEYYRFEQANQYAFRRTDVLGTILGRSPTTLRDWIEQHARELLPDDKPQG